VSSLKTILEILKPSQSFLQKIKFPPNLNDLPSTALYYYTNLLQAAIETPDPKYFRFNHSNSKILTKFDKTFNNCVQSATTFQDSKFPSQSTWRSPEDFLVKDQIKLFQEISPENIVQGNLGDCYLMGSLIVLSENPQIIKNLFKNDYNKYGLFGVWICESGAWRLLLIDQYIPCLNSNSGPCYARAKNNELWVMLLEKTYAKAYLGYKNIILGFSGDALKDLTGAPSEYIDLKEEKKSWDAMVSARKNNFVLCASTKINEELDSNLISKHNYAVLMLKEVNKKELWLKLQNPLQGFSWKNDYKISVDVEKTLDLNPNDKKKGIFWINFKDFRDNFEVVTCNKIHSDYFYSFVKIAEKTNPCIIRAIVLEKTHCYFSIHQKHERFFKGNKEKYMYSISRIIVCKVENNMIKDVIAGDFSTKQSSFIEVWLENGEYLIYGEVDFIQNICEKITISAYSDNPIVLDSMRKDSLNIGFFEILEEMFKMYIVKNPKISQITNYETGEITKYNGTLWGFVYFFYKNDAKELDLYEAVTLTKCDNLKKFYPFDSKNNNYFEVICQRNDFKLVLYKIGVKNNGSHACSMTSLVNLVENLDDKNLIEKAIKEGVKNKRNNDVFLFNYKFKGGTALVYQNNNQAVFEEKLMFKVLENIEIVLENGEVKGNSVAVKLQAKGCFLIRLNIKNTFVKKSGFNYSVN